jgi:CDP-diacylglycerol--glycerol-3-phosphate 3-phosphatidyltransferase
MRDHERDRAMTAGMRSTLVRRYYGILEKALRPFSKSGVSPDAVSYAGLAASLVAGFCYSRGAVFGGGLFLLLSGFLDTLDGCFARLAGRADRPGALLDSTLDRYAEFSVFFGLLAYYRESDTMSVVVFLALMGSTMVPYIKARGQSLGPVGTVGLMQRPERLTLLIGGSLLNGVSGLAFPAYPDAVLSATLLVLAVLANGTALHRLSAGKRDLAGGMGAGPRT